MSLSDVATDDERVLSWVRGYKNRGDSSEIGLTSSLYDACLRSLGSLSKQCSESRKLSPEKKARLAESHTRLCLFGAGLLNEGALEDCMKVDNILREEVMRLLYRLGKTLLRAAGSLYHVYDPVRTKEELILGIADLLKSASVVLFHQDELADGAPSYSDNSESEDSENEFEDTALNEDNDVLSAIDTYTTCLMDLRPILEQSLNDISNPVLSSTRILPTKFQVTEAARPFVLQVHDKFRTAKKALVERLGEANWQRYITLKRMAAGGKAQPEITVRESAVSEVPKSAFRPISQFQDSGLGSSLPTRTRYATSKASHTSFLSTDTDASKERSRVPSTPIEVSEGKAFTCSICTKTISGIKNRVDWKLHVFEDLNAYVCTFLDCPDFLTTYPKRKLWAEHEFTFHRSHQQYECYDCAQIFPNESVFISHISHEHDSKDLNHTRRLATISAAKRSVFNPLADQKCPLCHKTGWTLQRGFVTHLGRHLEEIALASLPREDDNESGSGSETDADIVEPPLPKVAAEKAGFVPGAANSPQKVQPPTPGATTHRYKEMPIIPDPAQPLDILTSIEQEPIQIPIYQETERSAGMISSSGNSRPPRITSYWSVPEQQKFPDLIAYFGRDFTAIAEFMKTKSSTMIKNFYTRELNNGKKELQDAARRAEGMYERGEPMGAPPTPVAPPKRRYEVKPSLASLPRPMVSLDLAAPNGDTASFESQPLINDHQINPRPTLQPQSHLQATADPRREVPRPASKPSVAQSESQEQASVKRSHIFSLLDDGPSEPAPPKRTSAEFYSPFDGSPSPNASRDTWFSRFDSRQRFAVTEPSPTQIPPPVVQYGSPNPAAPNSSRLQMDVPACQEPPHRSILGQLHPGHAPSLPPPMSVRGSTVAPPFRSASGSSQQHHSRVSSVGVPQSQPQQPQVQSSSAGPTPVSSLHESRGSLGGYEEQRLAFAQQAEQQVREQQVRLRQVQEQQIRDSQLRKQQVREQAREQEARQREYDLRQRQQYNYMQAQQQQQAQDMEQERYRYPGGPPRIFTPPNTKG